MHFCHFASQLGCALDFVIIFVPNHLRHCLISERRFHMAQRAIRFSERTDKEIQAATRKRGFSSPTAFIHHLVEQELSGRSEELVVAVDHRQPQPRYRLHAQRGDPLECGLHIR